MIGGWGVLRRHAFGFFFRAWLESFNFNFISYFFIIGMTDQEIIDSEAYYDHLSLYVCSMTTHAAKLSCGGVIEATLAVARGEVKRTFAIVRPPGHHAEPEEHMGFCFFNNVAVAAKVTQLLTPVKRILILDWYEWYRFTNEQLFTPLYL